MLEQIYTFKTYNILDTPRFEIWSKATNLIFQRPFLGWGASTFAIVYSLKGGFYKIQHTHNIPLELAYNFGIPLSSCSLYFFYYIYFLKDGK